jgi:protein-S-isoprenylcysteine O-methyltransferase Ste14
LPGAAGWEDEGEMADHVASLEVRSTRSALRFLATTACVLFAAAGTFDYWQAWIYLALQAVSLIAANAYMLRHDRELMRRRLAAEERGEQQRVQKLFMVLLAAFGLGGLVLAGLDRRLGWSAVPLPVVAGACLLFAVGASVVLLVLRANTFASSVIEVEARQVVVTTGPYRLVRHPMYTGMLLMIVAGPLALGSYYAEILLSPLLALFVIRLLAEERLLSSGLPGYAEYMGRTRKRLVPGLW